MMKGFLVVVGILIAGFLVLIPLGMVSSPSNPWTFALYQTKQVATSMLTYTSENDDRFPRVETWSDSLNPFLKNRELLTTRIEEGKLYISTAMNVCLDGARPVGHPNPDELVVFFSVKGRKVGSWGGPANVIEGQDIKAPVSFLDGHVKRCSQAQAFGLRWKP